MGLSSSMLKEIRINKKRELATNCRSCDDYLYKNRNPLDWRYCDECPANDKKVIKCKK